MNDKPINDTKMKRLLFITAILSLCIGASAQEKFYEIKSGKITMEMGMMGQTMVQEIYFDDYGTKLATVSNFNGQKMRATEIDGSNVMINDADKSAVRMPAMGPGAENRINWLNLDEKTVKKNKIKEIGEDTVAGKTCKKYSYKVMMMGQPITTMAWVYKGITLKTSTSTDFGDMVQTATSIEEDIKVDPAMFTIPEGVKIQDMDMSMMGGGF